ncbi:MAG: ROK family protein [Spirochaetaceae bacterium]|nr:MAG: ROK family protein [Spirochaetaceae bacterium]
MGNKLNLKVLDVQDQGQVYIGFDLGGTKMLAEVYNANFDCIGSSKRRTQVCDKQDLFLQIGETIKDALQKASKKQADMASIGIAVPGIVEVQTGRVRSLPNLNLHDLDVRGHLEAQFACPVWVDNDVNAGVYGEYRFGTARKAANVVGLFVGTGIGGGIIINGQLYRGAGGAAGELGHIIVQHGGAASPAGIRGTLESLASKTAMAKDLAMLAAAGHAPEINEFIGGDVSKVKSSILLKAWQSGNPALEAVIHKAAEYLGVGMAACVHLFNPEVLVIGGGVTEKLGKPYIKLAVKAMRAHCLPAMASEVQIIPSSLEDRAVPVGAALLAAENKV